MHIIKIIIAYLLGLFLILGAIAHLINPAFYAEMIPDFFPASLANILASISEGLIAFALFLPKYRRTGGLLFFLLMLAFLPLHIWDLLKEDPFMGSTIAAVIRILFQFLLLYAGWWVWKNHKIPA